MARRTQGTERSAGRKRRGVLGTLLYWAPVWLPGLLITQIVVHGLKPGLDESERLDVVEEELGEREARLAADALLQEENERRLSDEIYRERVRKSMGIPGEAPLRLEHKLPRDR